MAQVKLYKRKIIAEILELSDKRVKQLTDDGIIEEYSPGNYKLLPAVQGYIRFLRSQISDEDVTSNYNMEKARLTRLKRQDAELDLQVKMNDLHKSADVEFIMTNMLIAFKAKLEVLPYKVLPSVLNVPDGEGRADTITAVLKAAVEEALNELSGYDPALFDEEKYLARLDDTRTDEAVE